MHMHACIQTNRAPPLPYRALGCHQGGGGEVRRQQLPGRLRECRFEFADQRNIFHEAELTASCLSGAREEAPGAAAGQGALALGGTGVEGGLVASGRFKSYFLCLCVGVYIYVWAVF